MKTTVEYYKERYETTHKESLLNWDRKHLTSKGGGGSIAQWLAFLLPDPAALGSNHGSGGLFEKNSDVAVLIDSTLHLRWIAKSYYVDRTHTVPASVKLTLKK